MNNCIININKGLHLRIILTFIFFIIIKANEIDNLLLLIPIIYILLDDIDNIYLKEKCFKLFHYQKNDKIIDISSYILLLFIFKDDNILLNFIIYRLIGVILFTLTKKEIYLIIFFDFIKEYLLYKYFYKNNNDKMYYFIILKIILEIYYHKNLNQHNYKNEK